MRAHAYHVIEMEVKEDGFSPGLLPSDKKEKTDVFFQDQLLPEIWKIIFHYLENDISLAEISFSPRGRERLVDYILDKKLANKEWRKENNFPTGEQKEKIISEIKTDLVDFMFIGGKNLFNELNKYITLRNDQIRAQIVKSKTNKQRKYYLLFVAFVVFAMVELILYADRTKPLESQRDDLYQELLNLCGTLCEGIVPTGNSKCKKTAFVSHCDFQLKGCAPFYEKVRQYNSTWSAFDLACNAVGFSSSRALLASGGVAFFAAILFIFICLYMKYCTTKLTAQEILDSKVDVIFSEIYPFLEHEIISGVLAMHFVENIKKATINEIMNFDSGSYMKKFANKICDKININITEVSGTLFNSVRDKGKIIKAKIKKVSEVEIQTGRTCQISLA